MIPGTFSDPVRVACVFSNVLNPGALGLNGAIPCTIRLSNDQREPFFFFKEVLWCREALKLKSQFVLFTVFFEKKVKQIHYLFSEAYLGGRPKGVFFKNSHIFFSGFFSSI